MEGPYQNSTPLPHEEGMARFQRIKEILRGTTSPPLPPEETEEKTATPHFSLRKKRKGTQPPSRDSGIERDWMRRRENEEPYL